MGYHEVNDVSCFGFASVYTFMFGCYHFGFRCLCRLAYCTSSTRQVGYCGDRTWVTWYLQLLIRRNRFGTLVGLYNSGTLSRVPTFALYRNWCIFWRILIHLSIFFHGFFGKRFIFDLEMFEPHKQWDIQVSIQQYIILQVLVHVICHWSNTKENINI